MIPVVYRDIGFLMVYASFSKQGIAELSRSQRSTIGAREPIGSWHPRNFGSEKIVRTYVYVLFVRIACCSLRTDLDVPFPRGTSVNRLCSHGTQEAPPSVQSRNSCNLANSRESLASG